MITILWTMHGTEYWKQCEQEEAEELMTQLIADKNVITKDILIFFENSFPVSCWGDVYNIPVGTLVRSVSEGVEGKVVYRELTDSGIEYRIKTNYGRMIEKYGRDIEILEEMPQGIVLPDRCRVDLEDWRNMEIAPAAFYAAFPDIFKDTDTQWFKDRIREGHFLFYTGDQYSIIRFCPDCGKKLDYMKWIMGLWAALGDIPMNPDTERLEEHFLGFPAGTSRYDIWTWFEETFNVSVAVDLMG